jgi:hypothetical protein
MHAWHWLAQHEPEVSRDLELHIFGGTLDHTSTQLAEQWGLHDRIRPFGRIETDPATGESGRSQVLKRMRQCDVLLLVHGEDAICEEYIPSKVYEYLWMQRPILATVHDNPQMAEILRGQGDLWGLWCENNLKDSRQMSPYTTRSSTIQLVGWAEKIINAST